MRANCTVEFKHARFQDISRDEVTRFHNSSFGPRTAKGWYTSRKNQDRKNTATKMCRSYSMEFGLGITILLMYLGLNPILDLLMSQINIDEAKLTPQYYHKTVAQLSYIFAHATVPKRAFPHFPMHAAVARRTFSFWWMNPLAGFDGSIARNCGETQILSSRNCLEHCSGCFNAEHMEP